jgi:vacuolar iron transporter family protein
MPAVTDLWLTNLKDERDGAALYEGLAEAERDPAKAESFRDMAQSERRHAAVWERKLANEGAMVPPDKSSPRIRALLWLARRFGPGAVLPMAIAAETDGADSYAAQGGDATALVEEEREHRARLAKMTGPVHVGARSTIAKRERWHKGGRAGSIRAAIFGMNDGLLSNLSLILGVAATGLGSGDPHTLVLTGLAGLIAGAFSMAVGEYISVASQRDLLARQVELERRELADTPEEEAAELASIFEQKGLSADQAAHTAAELLKNPAQALDTLVREELGLDPEDLGSPLSAALSSFAMFAVGAFIPVVPFLLTAGAPAVVAAAALSVLVLGVVGGLVGFLSGGSVWRAAGRMVGLAVLAAGITYAVGRLFGAAVG